jgi:arginine-tRNA-protein transferase
MQDTDPYDEIARILAEFPPRRPPITYGRIYEAFYVKTIEPERLDELLAAGWRHFAESFYRYDRLLHDGEVRDVLPLRVRLSEFSPSKSQRRVLKRNSDLETAFGPAEVNAEAEELFERHRTRFAGNAPNSIYDYLSIFGPAELPCPVGQFTVRLAGKLLAVSYFDIGAASLSGIYAMFDPDESERGLGIYTMLKEIEHAIDTGRSFYYQGYAYAGESFYDYKKRFRGTEVFDWKEGWETFEEPSC